jgi:hypothetical protein
MTLESRLSQAEKRVPAKRVRPGVPRPANIIDFATNRRFLNVDLFPVQGTMLKVCTGAVDLLTDFDHEVIADWEKDWILGEDRGRLRYSGNEGTPPGLLERLELCRAAGRQGPEEVGLVLGRRASKGLNGAILVADLMYRLLGTDGIPDDPRPMKGKTLAVYVMGAKFEQAKRNAFADIKDLIENSPAFAPFLGACTTDSVTLLTPSQIEGGAKVGRTKGRLEVRAVETTPRAARGPTLIGLVMDEFAHVGNANPDSDMSSINIYRSAKPAVAQFPKTGLTLQTSSPWEKDGQLYESYELGCELDPDTLKPRVPTLLVLQLPSWAPYEHWARAAEIEMWPGGPCFPEHDGPIIERSGLLELYADIDPDAFAVEYGAQFAAGANSYLNSRTLARLVEPYEGWDMAVQVRGADNRRYAAHGDPSRVGDNFGFAIGHVRKDANGIPHVFIDDAFSWKPAEFPDHTINYIDIENQISEILSTFPVTTLTFDQMSSAGTIDRLQAFAAGPRSKHRTHVFERTATAPFNWRAAEVFKSAAMMGLIHIPPSLTEAFEELEALKVNGQRVDHPTTGRVRRKDIFDAIANVVYTLIGENWDATFERLAGLHLHASPGFSTVAPSVAPPTSRSNEEAIFARLGNFGSSRFSGHGAPRGAGYSAARGDRRDRGRHR